RVLRQNESAVAVGELCKVHEPALGTCLLGEAGRFRTEKRNIGIAADDLGDRRLRTPGRLWTDNLQPFLLKRATAQSDVLRRVEEAAQDLVEFHFLGARGNRKEYGRRKRQHGGTGHAGLNPRTTRLHYRSHHSSFLAIIPSEKVWHEFHQVFAASGRTGRGPNPGGGIRRFEAAS